MRHNCVTLLCVLVVVISMLSGCKYHEKEYYANFDHFITEEAVVEKINYNEEDNYIVLILGEIDETYQDNNFIIRSDNADIVLENGLLYTLQIGDVITFTSAPQIFGDGYMMPIVSLSVEGKELLNINIGYQNLMNSF